MGGCRDCPGSSVFVYTLKINFLMGSSILVIAVDKKGIQIIFFCFSMRTYVNMEGRHF